MIWDIYNVFVLSGQVKPSCSTKRKQCITMLLCLKTVSVKWAPPSTTCGFIHLFIYLSFHPSCIHCLSNPSICLGTQPPTQPPTHPSTHPPVHPSIHLPTYPSSHPVTHPTIHPPIQQTLIHFLKTFTSFLLPCLTEMHFDPIKPSLSTGNAFLFVHFVKSHWSLIKFIVDYFWEDPSWTSTVSPWCYLAS